MSGLRSMEILQSLHRARFAGVAAERASRTAGDLQWRPAQSGAIQRDPGRTAWHSGHVDALLSDGNSVIAGTQTGGVWVIDPIPAPSFRDGYRATPLSDGWSTPDIGALAWGPDGMRHVYAGCENADSLFAIELEAVPGALLPRRTNLAIPLPERCSVRSIAVLEEVRRIVIATTAGLFWSDIPPDPADVASYAWNEPEGLPRTRCASVVRGPGTSLAVNVTDKAPSANEKPRPPVPDRLYFGDWLEGVLRFEEAAVPEIVRSSFDFVLASCLQARERMYGVAMQSDGQAIASVLRSDDGGRTWFEVAIPEGAGVQGSHNRAIAVSPYRPDVVALGWQMPGPFLSTDGGATWAFLGGGDDTDANGQPCRGSRAGLHADIHALCFPLNPLETDQLFIGSDGGIAVTRDLGRCFDSEYSRPLHALQFYGTEKNPPTLSVSSAFPGLVTGGTQDNGIVTLHPDADAGPVWHSVTGGDGGTTRFLDPIAALLHENNEERRIRMTTWDPAASAFAGAGAVVEPGVASRIFEAVRAPNWGRDGRLMYAVAGTAQGELFGLFADPDAGNARFGRLADVGSGITAVASLFGAEVLVGCENGRIVVVDSGSGNVTEQPRDPGFGEIKRFELVSRDVAYALIGTTFWRFDGGRWTVIPGPVQPWTTFTLDRETGRLFAATDADVFVSSDGAKSWTDASAGLPARPHCTDLRIGADADGGSTLYLSTYGRSVWKARITFPPDRGPNFDLPPDSRELLFGIIQDGGGVIRTGGRLVRIKPRQLATDIFAALAIDETARTMSPEAGREIRRTTLKELIVVLKGEMERLG